MNFIDFIILVIVLGTLALIAYYNFIKKDKDICSKCAYRREKCNCRKFLKNLFISWKAINKNFE